MWAKDAASKEEGLVVLLLDIVDAVLSTLVVAGLFQFLARNAPLEEPAFCAWYGVHHVWSRGGALMTFPEYVPGLWVEVGFMKNLALSDGFVALCLKMLGQSDRILQLVDLAEVACTIVSREAGNVGPETEGGLGCGKSLWSLGP